MMQALEIKKAKLGEDDLQIAVMLQSLGVCLRDAKRYEEAEELLRQASEIKRQSWARTISRSHIHCNRSACAYGTQSGKPRRRRC